MYPSVTQFETRRRQVEEWIATRRAGLAVVRQTPALRTRPRGLVRLAAAMRSRLDPAPSPSRSSGLPTLLPRRERDALTRLSSTIEVPAGNRVVSQGHEPDSFFLVERGYVAVVRDSRNVANLGPGDFFGEIALVQRRTRTATVVATTDVCVRVVSQREFVTAMRILPTFAGVLQDATRTRLLPASP